MLVFLAQVAALILWYIYPTLPVWLVFLPVIWFAFWMVVAGAIFVAAFVTGFKVMK